VSKNFEVIFKEFMSSETFVMSRELLEDYKRQAAQDERKRIERAMIDNKRRFTHYVNGEVVCFSYIMIDLLKEIDDDNK